MASEKQHSRLSFGHHTHAQTPRVVAPFDLHTHAYTPRVVTPFDRHMHVNTHGVITPFAATHICEHSRGSNSPRRHAI